METYEEINERIERKKAVVVTAEEIIGYVEAKGLDAAARKVNVVTTATFGAMCSSAEHFPFPVLTGDEPALDGGISMRRGRMRGGA
jgi:uncharacterized protein (DUF39 family)